jgi:cob(I)alamin adenosyltransferase
MAYTIDDIEKIAEFKSWSNKRKVDALLEIDADLYCNLGKESSKTEIEAIKIQSRKIYRLIKTIDEYSGKLLLRNEAR